MQVDHTGVYVPSSSAQARARRQRQSGFSLVELLVVIGIIAILAGVMMSAIAVVRDSAKSMACQSNLRQIYVAYEGYAQDNNGLVARACIQSGQFWFQYIADYAEAANGDAVANPGTVNRRSVIWGCPAWAKTNGWWVPSYGVNMWLMEPVKHPVTGWPYGNGWFPPGDGWSGSFREFQMGNITNASSRCLVGDSWNWPISPDVASARHKGKINLVFCDGHVGALIPSALQRSVSNPAKL